MASIDWRIEMDNMLAAFNRQATHSLGIIRSAFKRSGLSFTPEFKQHFIQASINRIIETYSRFEINSMLEDHVNITLNSDVNVPKGLSCNDEYPEKSIRCLDNLIDGFFNQINKPIQVDALRDAEMKLETNTSISNTFNRGKSGSLSANTFGPIIQIDDSDDEEAVIVITEVEPTNDTASGNALSSNDAQTNKSENDLILMANQNTFGDKKDLIGTDQTVFQNNSPSLSYNHNLGGNVKSDPILETGKSNEVIETVQKQMIPNFGHEMCIPVKVALDRLDTTTVARLAKNLKNPNESIYSQETKRRRISIDLHGMACPNRGETVDRSKNSDESVKHQTENNDDIKQKVKEINDDIPMIRIEVNRKVPTPTREQEENHDDNNNIHGTATTLVNENVSSGLNVHLRTHTGEKRYACNRCEKRFTKSNDLKRHSIIHDYPFQCKGCFGRFLEKTEKEDHEKQCNARRYEYHLCNKFVTYLDSGKHMRKQTKEKPFRCEICMKRFAHKSSLKTHLKNIHGVNQLTTF